jgi:salicylate biosynthesis isochorismate synthase
LSEAVQRVFPAADWLDPNTLRRLEQRLEAALRRSRGIGSATLASVTAICDRAGDPTALAAASRRPGEPWFCIEQPDRQGSAIAALGCVRALEARGPDRFARVAEGWRALAAGAFADAPEGPPGSGLVALGGFAFAPEGGSSRRWEGFAPASLMLPELSLARCAGSTWLTVNVEVAPDDIVPDLLAGVERRLAELRETPLPLLDPAPAGTYEVLSPIPPSHY